MFSQFKYLHREINAGGSYSDISYLPVAKINSSLVDHIALKTVCLCPLKVCVADPDFRSKSLTLELPVATATKQCCVAVEDMWCV